VVLAGAMVSAPLVNGTTASAASRPPTRIDWTPCPNRPGYRCGTLGVPLDYQHPSRGSMRLAVIEHPAPHSQGVVIFNPGGPGESGVLIFPILVSFVPAAVRDQFTLVSFDERGTGSSQPLLCGPSAAAASSAVAGTQAATQVFGGVEQSCRSDYPALFDTVTTTTSARDMDQLRAALGVSRINYYGISYGTVLGSVYRQLFPDHVRSMVLDGAVDANLSLSTDATEEAPAIQTALEHELNSCADIQGCSLGPHPVAAYEDLRQQLARAPLPAPGDGDTTPVTEGDLSTATLLYLSVPTLTPGYFQALAAAAFGDGTPLRSVALGLETDLDGNSLVGPLWTITCNDAIAHPDGQSTAALARSLAARYPLGGAEAVSNNLIGCSGWGSSNGAVGHLSPNSAPTPLVIGNTYDPNTPYASARQLTSTIGGRLVTYVGYGHSWILNGSKNGCMQKVVSAYFVHGTLPARGTRCQA
jgi:pimeloyl-ACP methyl ester carboxylesterase